MAQEIELKLGITPKAAALLRKSPVLLVHAQGKPVTRNLVSTYFDTEDLALLAQRVALRVRKVGRKRIQTLKGGGTGTGSLQSRFEVECEIKGDEPDLDRITEPELRRLVAEQAARLRPVFTTDVRRTAWYLKVAGSEIELALDQGEIRGLHGTLPIDEIELELMSGEPAQLFALAFQLLETVPLTLEHRSKAERGYALASGSEPVPAKAALFALSPRMSIDEGLAAIIGGCLHQLRANQACAVLGADPEGVHQARVALRQLRSAFTLFADRVPLAALERLKTDLRRLANALGPAREWDVFSLETLPAIQAALPEDEALSRMAVDVARQRNAAQAEIRGAFADPAATAVVLLLECWLETGLWSGCAVPEPVEKAGIRAFAVERLKARDRSLRKRARKLETLSGAELHQMRIAAKKLRYAVHFFEELFDSDAVEKTVEVLKTLQDGLGAINDAVTARAQTQILEAAIAAGGAERLAARGAGIIDGWHAARIVEGRRRLKKKWAAYRRCAPFWKGRG